MDFHFSKINCFKANAYLNCVGAVGAKGFVANEILSIILLRRSSAHLDLQKKV